MFTRRAQLASGNANKLRELQVALAGWHVELLGAQAFPEETGDTYYENARAKALYGREVGDPDAWVLGEDSGIEVDALGGRPGVQSARWAGPDGDPIAKLLAELEGEPSPARYVCELVCITPAGDELRGTGTLSGTIADAPRGSEGFGYDPVFIPEGETRTVAELGNAWKTRSSHRTRAARALVARLRA